MLCSVGSIEPMGASGNGACMPLPATGGALPRCTHGAAGRRVQVLALLALRGGGARNKWRRKQNQNRAAGGGHAGGGRARDRAGGGKRSGGADGAGGGAACFQTRWQNFARSGGGRQPRDAASEESVMSSQDVDSEGNEFVYVDGSDSGMDMGDSDEYIYVDEVCAVCAACGCAASASSANAAVTSYVLVSCHHTALQSR